MTVDDQLSNALQLLPKIATEDVVPFDTLPALLAAKYEIRSFRNATSLLLSAWPQEAAELFQALGNFEISVEDILKKGGNKSEVAKKLESTLHRLGWNETRISGDLIVRKRSKYLNVGKRSPKFIPNYHTSILKNFLDGHQIDFVKGRVAFDLEWNSKDQTFDRDLYAMRAFYECGVIDVGIILTRSTTLSTMLAEIASRVDSVKSFKEKYGASTTWMGKLDYRINAGRAGGCPILALGFKESVFFDLVAWKKRNPIVQRVSPESLTEIDSDQED